MGGHCDPPWTAPRTCCCRRGPPPPPWAAPASSHMTRSPHSWVQMTKNQKQVFKQTLYTHIHSSTAHNGPEVETTQVSIKG